MSKKLTRKGLAFGTSVALGIVSLTSAVPALAVSSVDPVSLSPNGGTSYNTLSGSAFELRTVLSLSALSNEAQDDSASNPDGVYSDETLKFLINDADQGLNYSEDFYDGGGVGAYNAPAVAFGTNNQGDDWDSWGIDTNDSSTNSQWSTEDHYVSDVEDDINLVGDDGVTVIDTHQRPLGKTSILRLLPNNYEESFSVDVTAWVDWNNDNLINNGETASPVRTVNFVGHQDINANLASISGLTVGNNDFDAKVELSTSLTSEDDNTKLNTVQIAREDDNSGDFWTNSLSYQGWTADYVEFDSNFAAADSADASYTSEWAGWDYTATEGTVSVYDNNTPEDFTAGVFSLDVFQYNEADDSDFDITTLSVDVTETYADEMSAELHDTADTNTNGDIRTGVKSAKIDVEVLDNNGDAMPAGTKVTVTVDSSDYPVVKAGDAVTVGGTAIVNRASNSAFKLELTTDKDGKISVPVTSTLGSKGNYVSLKFSAADGDVTDYLDLSWEDAAPSAATTYIMEEPGDAQDAAFSIIKGGSVNITIGAYDQFGGAISGTDYQVIAYNDYTDDEDADLQASSGTKVKSSATGVTPVVYDNDMKALPISNGKASFKFVSNGNTVDDYMDVSFAVVKADATYSAINAASEDDYAYAEINIVGKDELPSAAAVIEVYSSNPTASGAREIAGEQGLAGADLTAYDARTQVGTEGSYDDFVRIEGGVLNQFDNYIYGAPVTISGSGLLFEAADYDENYGAGVYGLGSLTVQSDDSADFAFNVYSNKSGKQTITLKSGTVTQTVEITFADAGVTEATSLTLNVPAVVTPGTSIAGFGILTDKYGNGVASDDGDATFEITMSGVTGGEDLFASEDTDANGRFSFGYSTATTSNGTVTVTATYDADGTGSTYAPISKTVAVKVGKPSSAYAYGGKKSTKVVVANSNGQSVQIYVSNVLKKTVIATSDRDVYSIALKGFGKKTVKVLVDGKRVFSKLLTITK